MPKKKIGIVTWYHKGYNFGSSLQAYSTQTILEKLGYEAELINYSPEGKKLRKFLKECAKYIYVMLMIPSVYKTWRKVDKWTEKNLNVSECYDSWSALVENAEKYDAVICGSDQIWRTPKDGVIDPFYFIQFIGQNKRIAYAPSIARDYIDKKIVDQFANYINEIKYLSIREKQGADLIKKITNREAQVVLDPTLLLTKEEWESIIKNKKNFDTDYVFCYFLSKNQRNWDEVVNFSVKKNLEIITPAIFSNAHKNSWPLDPFEFIYLIKNAKFVITDSFHGIAFCIILQKQFAVYKRFSDNYKNSQNSRIYNILEEFGLSERLVDGSVNLELVIERNINFVEVEDILIKSRYISIEYLEKSLELVLR